MPGCVPLGGDQSIKNLAYPEIRKPLFYIQKPAVFEYKKVVS